MRISNICSPLDPSQDVSASDLHQTIVVAGASVLLTPAMLEKQATCDHDWELDGQTMTCVRWTCTKCFKTELR